MSAKRPTSIAALQVRHVAKLEARIAQLEAGLNRIKSLADAPYAAPGVPGEPLVDAVLEWAVNEAEAALKETP